jgi:hypothetical protein
MMMGHNEVIPHLHGYGIPLVNQDISFSSGYYFMTDLTPGIFWAGRTSICKVMIVFV